MNIHEKMQLKLRIEGFFGWLLFNFKDHENKMFTKKSMFADVPCAIEVECIDTSVPNRLEQRHELLKDNQFPCISWKLGDSLAADIKTFAIIVQDIDLPLPFVALHGCFFNISAEKRAFNEEDIIAIREKNSNVKYIKNILGTIYEGPRPLMNHGDHRYVYQIIGLKTPLDVSSEAKFEVFENSFLENILAYGSWTGAYKRENQLLE